LKSFETTSIICNNQLVTMERRSYWSCWSYSLIHRKVVLEVLDLRVGRNVDASNKPMPIGAISQPPDPKSNPSIEMPLTSQRKRSNWAALAPASPHVLCWVDSATHIRLLMRTVTASVPDETLQAIERVSLKKDTLLVNSSLLWGSYLSSFPRFVVAVCGFRSTHLSFFLRLKW